MPQPGLKRDRQATPGLQLLRVRIDLKHAHPPIWRSLELRSDLTLDKVHAVLQAAFEWQNSHLHEFSAPAPDAMGVLTRYEPGFQQEMTSEMGLGLDVAEGLGPTPRFETLNEEDVTLGSLLRRKGDMLDYTYDFGDSWEHRIRVDHVAPATPDTPPARCVGGAKAAPPDDSGGIWTYQNVVDLMRHPDHPQDAGFEDHIEWMRETMRGDPDTFDLERAQARIDIAVASGYTWWFEGEDFEDDGEDIDDG